MSDGFENTYFTSPFAGIATDDTDGDGQNNLAESIAGTSPLDPSSALRIINIVRQPSGNVDITWTSVATRQYIVHATTNLTGTAFTPLPGTNTATGATHTYTDIVPSPSSKFYKVQVLP
jgi:hypothetical protein